MADKKVISLEDFAKRKAAEQSKSKIDKKPNKYNPLKYFQGRSSKRKIVGSIVGVVISAAACVYLALTLESKSQDYGEQQLITAFDQDGDGEVIGQEFLDGYKRATNSTFVGKIDPDDSVSFKIREEKTSITSNNNTVFMSIEKAVQLAEKGNYCTGPIE